MGATGAICVIVPEPRCEGDFRRRSRGGWGRCRQQIFRGGGVKNVRFAIALSALIFGAALLAVVLLLNPGFSSPVLAADQARAFTERDVKDPAARQLVSDGLKAFRSGKRTLGISILKRAASAAPKEGLVLYLLARAQLIGHDPVSAERNFRAARADGFPDETVLPSLFDAMIERHEENRILQEFPRPVGSTNRNLGAKIFRGRAMALLSLGRVDEAAAEMDLSLELDRAVPSLLERAQIAERQKNSALVTKLLDESLTREPKNGHVLLAKLDDLAHSNDDAALGFSERILKQFPQDITTRGTRIEIFLKKHQDAKAKTELESILALGPKAANFPLVRYYTALVTARTSGAEAAWKIAQLLPPAFAKEKPAYALQLSQLATDSGHVDAAVALLAGALGKWPDQINLRVRLGALQMKQNEARATLMVMNPLQDSNDPEALDILGWARLQTDDLKGALEVLKRANQLQPHNAQVIRHLAQALKESGDDKAATALLKRM